MDRSRRGRRHLVDPARHIERCDDHRRDRRLIDGSRVFDRLHGGGQIDPPLYGVFEPIHFLYAGSDYVERLPAAVFRLGRRRTDVISADRLLVRSAFRQCCGDQGIYCQPNRRFRVFARYFRRLCDFRHAQFPRGFRPRAKSRRHDHGFSRLAGRFADPRLHSAVYRRHGEIGAAAAAYLAARCDGGPDPGFRLDPRGDDGDRRCLHGGAVIAALRVLRDGPCRRRRHRRNHRDLCRERRNGAERHQESRRLFDLQPTRLHVHRRRRLGLSG